MRKFGTKSNDHLKMVVDDDARCENDVKQLRALLLGTMTFCVKAPLFIMHLYGKPRRFWYIAGRRKEEQITPPKFISTKANRESVANARLSNDLF
jgi:hypothetical protein